MLEHNGDDEMGAEKNSKLKGPGREGTREGDEVKSRRKRK